MLLWARHALYAENKVTLRVVSLQGLRPSVDVEYCRITSWLSPAPGHGVTMLQCASAGEKEGRPSQRTLLRAGSKTGRRDQTLSKRYLTESYQVRLLHIASAESSSRMVQRARSNDLNAQ